MTPSAWKNGGAGTVIRWSLVDTSLGQMLVAATEKGICRLSFDERGNDEDLTQVRRAEDAAGALA